MNYDKMEAGREVDALVAEKIMGWKVERFPNWNRCEVKKETCTITGAVPEYSTSISAAWEVVEKMRITYPYFGAFSLDEKREGWNAHWAGVDVFAPTAPLAICLAALKAMEEK